MKNVVLFFVAFSTFQKHLHAFHKESYYGDPYSMEYVGKFSTVNLTKEDLLWADYVVEMLRNTSYSTIDFNASMTYPSRFKHLYETGVPTISTRRFATTSTKSLTRDVWTYPRNEFKFSTSDFDLWETSSSISFTFSTVDARNSRVQKKSDSSLLLDKTGRYLRTKNIEPLWTTMSEDRLAMVRDIIRRNVIKKPETRYTERRIPQEVTEERKKHPIYHTTDSTTTRTRRSVPFFLDSDEGPWLTTKEQEQEWALRGTSLLDSEKYDYPFPYDADKWPGCTTKDLTDPKNTVQILEYENGHIRFIGVSKPGWNEFPWKPTEFTTVYPAYRGLDKYLTYLSRPWYGYYSTLYPPASMNWNKRTTRVWSRYTFGNRSWKSRYDTTGFKKWIIDRWPPDWNRTIFPRSSANTRKRTLWGGNWHLPTRIYSMKVNPNTSEPYIDYSKSNTNILTLLNTLKPTGDVDSSKRSPITLTRFPDTSKPSADTKNPAFHPQKPIFSTSKSSIASEKSTPGFGFLSISPTWYTYGGNLSHTFRHNATWVAEWSRMLYSASKTLWRKEPFSKSSLSYMEKCNKEFSLPVYTLGNTTQTQQDNWLTLSPTPSMITWSTSFHTKPNQWNGGYTNQLNTERPREWSTSAKQNKGGWALPELKRGSTKSPVWSETLNTNKQFQQFYSNQWGAGGGGRPTTWNKQMAPLSSRTLYPKAYQQYSNQWNKQGSPMGAIYQTERNQKWTPGPQQYRGAPNTWPKTWANQNQWNRQQPLTGSRPWYTNPKPYQQFPPNQWGRSGGSNVWNRGVPPSGSKTFYTNQQYPNQGNKGGQPAWTRSWNTKPYQFYPNQRNMGGNLNQWNAQKPRELSSWTTRGRGGWPPSWTKSWDRGQSPTRSRTWYPSPPPSFN